MIRHAVFPVAGIGSRFLPFTKTLPKEMLPLVDTPLIQYAVEEAVACGVSELIFVISAAKDALRRYFSPNTILEQQLKHLHKEELLERIAHTLPDHVTCHFVEQAEPLGLGHAISCTRDLLQGQDFAVILADDVFKSDTPALQQLLDHHQANTTTLGLATVSDHEVHQYGMVELDGNKINNIIEKPRPDQTPSRLSVVGRYILAATVFEQLDTLPAASEIELTSAIAELVKAQQVYGYRLQGQRFDCGRPLGYIQACVAYGLERDELQKPLRDYLLKIGTTYND